MERTEVEGGKGTIALREDGIIHLLWDSKVKIEATDAHAAMAAVDIIADGAEYPWSVDMTATVSLSRQARSVFGIRCGRFAHRFARQQPCEPDTRKLVHGFAKASVPNTLLRFTD
ncbi:STAS/SEC14 domain-containing protein [Paenarthrobacter sp. PH39-S1]|uniref:DUF7793 family protein n=1 Tax=Paenarthrobacter sp. PH39-S1 TaxID=3046204 RepID=UPI0032D9361E